MRLRFFFRKKTSSLSRVENLLEGINYTVSLGFFGPFCEETILESLLKSEFSKDIVIGSSDAISINFMCTDIMKQLLWEGYSNSAPDQLEKKKAEISELMSAFFIQKDILTADKIIEFEFSKGHVFYPVFWDFAYDIHIKGQRWIFIGSASD